MPTRTSSRPQIWKSPGLKVRSILRRWVSVTRRAKTILRDFDLHVRPGENLAIVGHTGAGKSSLAKLIARFYEFQSGELLLDGQDIRSFDLGVYRRQLGIVIAGSFPVLRHGG